MTNLFYLLTTIMLTFHVSVAPAFNDRIVPKKNLLHFAIEDAEYIPWLHQRKLTWEDFQCEPVRNTEAVALTSTALGLSYRVSNGQFIYEISCGFAKTRSWGLLKTSYILAHEQAHFDITELFARKLHQELEQYQFNRKSFKKDVNTLYQKVVKEKEMFQELYDKQTDHSRNHTQQQQWLTRIDQLLEETDAFANYP